MAKKTSKAKPTKNTPNKNKAKTIKKINKKISKKPNDLKQILDSKLITDINQIELIKTGIKNFDKTKELQLKLLFRASRDGDNNKSYHKLCDGISPTVNIIKSKSGYTFGGYTDCILNSNDGCTKTTNSFVFSFNKMKIYNGVDGGYFHCGTDCGPWFCGCVGVEGDNYFNTEKSYQWEINRFRYFEGFTEEYELVGGTRHFSVEEVEVFKVDFISKESSLYKEKEISLENKKDEIKIIPLNFVNNWKNFGGEYAPGRIIKKGNEITLSGVVKGSNFSTVCVLPEDCRPKYRLIFSVNQNSSIIRFDIFSNGNVTFQSGNNLLDWISLDGIHFFAGV